MPTESTRDRIHAAAVEHGWHGATNRAAATYRKGDKIVRVEFSTRGAVTYASVNFKRAVGAGKADQAIAWLSA